MPDEAPPASRYPTGSLPHRTEQLNRWTQELKAQGQRETSSTFPSDLTDPLLTRATELVGEEDKGGFQLPDGSIVQIDISHKIRLWDKNARSRMLLPKQKVTTITVSTPKSLTPKRNPGADDYLFHTKFSFEPNKLGTVVHQAIRFNNGKDWIETKAKPTQERIESLTTMLADIDPSSKMKNSRRQLLITASGLAVAGGLAAAGLGAKEYTERYQPTHEPTTPTETNPPELKVPYNPTDEEMNAVAAIFDQPSKYPDITGRTDDEIEKARMANRLQSAKDNKLTLFDYRTPYADLFEDVEKPEPTIEFSTYLTKAQEFLEQYGITLSLGTDTMPDVYAHNGVPLDQAKLNDPKTKKALVEMISTIGSLPVELFKMMGHKNIVMIDLSNSHGAGGYADRFEKDTYYFDPIQFASNPRAFLHEAYHLYDMNHAASFLVREDKSYRAINPVRIYTSDSYGLIDDSDKPQNDGTYISNDLYLVTPGSDDAKKAKVVTVTDYAFKNVMEDKADLASYMLDHKLINDILDPTKPILYKKALFLLARLAHHMKRDYPESDIIKFLADTRVNPQ